MYSTPLLYIVKVNMLNEVEAALHPFETNLPVYLSIGPDSRTFRSHAPTMAYRRLLLSVVLRHSSCSFHRAAIVWK